MRGKWEYKGHWLDNNVTGSNRYYVLWYPSQQDRRAGRPRRKTLGTDEIEDAKERLVEFVMRKHTGADDSKIIAVVEKYVEEVADTLGQPKAPKQALRHMKHALEGTECISDLTKEFQRDCLMKRWREDFGHSAATISRTLSVLKSAITHCGIEGAPQIQHPERQVCKLLRIKPNNKEKWIPSDDELARFLDALGSELAFRWIMICLNTACRPEAGIDLGPASINTENRTIDLNPRGRLQEPTKWRPILRFTENLAGWTEEWDPRIQTVKGEAEVQILKREQPWKLEPRFVPFRGTSSLSSAFKRTRSLSDKNGEVIIDMPRMCPYSIRNKMVTVMRASSVPGSQRSMWMGHMDEEERQITSQAYGAYDPSFLKDAADATDEFMFKLNKRTDRDLFAKSHGKSTAKDNIVQLK